MKVRIKQDFTGYPDGGDRAPREFRAGQTIDVDDDFGRLIVGKGHAEEHDAPPAEARKTEGEDDAS